MRQPHQADADAPHQASLSRRQARQLTETAYLAAATALLWVGLYYLPVGGALFRLALPLPLALLQLRHNRRCAVEGVAVSALLLVALMGPVRGPLVLFPYTLLALWLGWCWTRQLSWWFSWGVGVLIGATGFLVRVAVVSVLLGENLWVVITTQRFSPSNTDTTATRTRNPVAPINTPTPQLIHQLSCRVQHQPNHRASRV